MSGALEPEAFRGLWNTHAEVENALLFPLDMLLSYSRTAFISDSIWDGLKTCSALWISADIIGENASVNFEFCL